jgi:hypothetical protein
LFHCCTWNAPESQTDDETPMCAGQRRQTRPQQATMSTSGVCLFSATRQYQLLLAPWLQYLNGPTLFRRHRSRTNIAVSSIKRRERIVNSDRTSNSCRVAWLWQCLQTTGNTEVGDSQLARAMLPMQALPWRTGTRPALQNNTSSKLKAKNGVLKLLMKIKSFVQR